MGTMPDGYGDYLIGLRLSSTTVRRYQRWIRDAHDWFTERGATLAEATNSEIREWSEMRVTDSHACRGQASAALTHYWNHIERWHAPRTAVLVPQAPEMVCRAIEPDEATRLLKASVGWWPQGTAVLCGMFLALRRFEIAKMEWERFDTDSNGDWWYTVTGKYSKTRTLPVHPRLAAELPRRDSGWVFPGRFDGPVVPMTITAWVHTVGVEAGIEHLKPHELRHTALATANDTLGDLRAVQTFARHTNPVTTAGYTRTTKRRLREVSESLDYSPDAYRSG